MSTFNKDRRLGIGGAPTRATILPSDAAERKQYPVASGVLDYFPDALVAISRVSYLGNQQHNPGKPLHWDRSKSSDEDDTLIRHFLQRGTLDVDGTPHTVKMAWRALALLQKELEAQALQEQEIAEKPPAEVSLGDLILFQAGIESSSGSGGISWTNEFVFAPSQAAAEDHFGKIGFYRNLVVRTVKAAHKR